MKKYLLSLALLACTTPDPPCQLPFVGGIYQCMITGFGSMKCDINMTAKEYDGVAYCTANLNCDGIEIKLINPQTSISNPYTAVDNVKLTGYTMNSSENRDIICGMPSFCHGPLKQE